MFARQPVRSAAKMSQDRDKMPTSAVRILLFRRGSDVVKKKTGTAGSRGLRRGSRIQLGVIASANNHDILQQRQGEVRVNSTSNMRARGVIQLAALLGTASFAAIA